jgi:hypothetical protein
MTWCKTVAIVLSICLAWFTIMGTSQTRDMIFFAAVQSLIWVVWYNYDYTSQDQIKIGRFNLMTWAAWTLGLVVLGMWWLYLSNACPNLSLLTRLIITGLLWNVTIMVIEYIGYNWMGIQLKSKYPGVFGLNLMHGPKYLQFYYLLLSWVAFLAIFNNCCNWGEVLHQTQKIHPFGWAIILFLLTIFTNVIAKRVKRKKARQN